MLIWLLACTGSDDTTDAGDPCPTGDTGEPCGGGPTDPTDPAGPAEGQGTPSDGDPFTFVAVSAVGGWNATDWGFTLMGDAATNTLSFGVSGAPAPGTYAIGDDDSPNYSTYTDFRNFTLRTGGFVSTSGELVVDAVDPHAPVGGADAREISGTWVVSYSNEQEPPITLTLAGAFRGVVLIGE